MIFYIESLKVASGTKTFYPPSMAKLSTEIARELFLYGPSGGKRVTSVKALSTASGASERAIYEHLPSWRRESEELAVNSSESGLVLSLSTSALEAHKRDVEFLRCEVDRLKLHLRSLSVGDESYSNISRALLATERQWASISGVMAALEAAAARLKEKERLEAKAEMRDATPPQNEPPAPNLRSGVFARRASTVSAS